VKNRKTSFALVSLSCDIDSNSRELIGTVANHVVHPMS
jgi:hypothetical protein